MRDVVLDTETTGLHAAGGDRIVEIGCVELANGLPNGREFHVHLRPEGRSMSAEATAVNGLTDDFLSDKPTFGAIVDDFLSFIGDDPLIIHNAPFDMGFLNMELLSVRRPQLAFDRVVDTLTLARARFPGSHVSLDALCRRFGIDLADRRRTGHGALKDAKLLAAVHLELCGGRQPTLSLLDAPPPTVRGAPHDAAAAPTRCAPAAAGRAKTPLRRLDDDERTAHDALLDSLEGTPVWRAPHDARPESENSVPDDAMIPTMTNGR